MSQLETFLRFVEGLLERVERLYGESVDSNIQFVTPVQRHTGEDREILIKRQAVYDAAKAKNPARWSQDTRNWEWQPVVCLNPDNPNDQAVENPSKSVH